MEIDLNESLRQIIREEFAKPKMDYRIYKGKSAAQFSLGSVTITDEGKYKAGAIYVEMAPSSGVRQYDWKRKVKFALSVQELGHLLMSLTDGRQAEFFHDPFVQDPERRGKDTKKMTFGLHEKGEVFMMNIHARKDGQATASYNIPIDLHEAAVLKSLIQTAIPKVLGWIT